jgi:hypothetical protein
MYRNLTRAIRNSLALTSIFIIPTAASSEVILNWNVESAALGSFTNGSGSPFNDINKYDQIVVDVSSDFAHSGTKSIKISYPVDEAGVELQKSFPATKSLYTRKYEYFAPGWEGNWPVGLKTSRYFTGTGAATDAYHSEKMIWQTYDSTCSEQYGMGLNSAIGNLDLEKMYNSSQTFGNGQPFIRTGHWYKMETWMVLNSGDGVANGILKIWVDDALVYDNSAVKWVDSTRGRSGGLAGWTSMWYGGNYSGAICGSPSQPVRRYIDDFYLSTTLDRTDSLALPAEAPPVQGLIINAK